MTGFAFTYPLGENSSYGEGVVFAELDGRATVDCDGDIEIELFDLCTNDLIPADNYLCKLIEPWLRAERSEQVREAHDEARAGRRAYDREIARAAE